MQLAVIVKQSGKAWLESTVFRNIKDYLAIIAILTAHSLQLEINSILGHTRDLKNCTGN